MEYISITEFRKNTKVILDGAEYAPVIIRRGDELYRLEKAGNVLTSGLNILAAPASPMDKVMDKAYEGLADKFAELAPRSEPVKESPVTDEFPTIPDIRERTWQTVLNEINPLKKKIEALRAEGEFNQDPDFWDVIRLKEAQLQALWNEYHLLKGEK